MSKKLLMLCSALLMIVVMAVAGCGGEDKAKNDAKVLRVGTEATYAPFEFQDDKSKEYIGFDMDLIRAVGKQMGYEVQIQNLSFDGLIPALEAGNIDIAASGMTITEERAKKILFSEPYYKAGISVMVKENNNDIKSFNDLAGKSVAVQIGTVSAEAASKIPNAKVREFNNSSEVYLELGINGVDAAINDLPVSAYYLQQNPNCGNKILSDVRSVESYGFAMSKKDAELKAKVDAALAELKKNGEYEKIYMKWFKQKPQA